MPKLLVFYYSSSGNTEKMAQAVAEGAKSIENIDVQLGYQINVDELNEFHAIIIGTPTYRKQMPIAIKTFLDEVSAKGISLKGKIGSVFGSYGWSG